VDYRDRHETLSKFREAHPTRRSLAHPDGLAVWGHPDRINRARWRRRRSQGTTRRGGRLAVPTRIFR